MSEKYDIAQNFEPKTPPGDTHERLVCAACGFVDYRNPKIVVGSVALQGDKLLLCRRAIDPRKGFWTLPAGFLEIGETAEEGARREAMEEAGARLEIDRLLAVYSVPRISQVQIMYRARIVNRDIEAGPESAEIGLFAWEDIPWTDIAFPTVGWALRHYRETLGKTDFAPFSNPQDGL